MTSIDPHRDRADDPTPIEPSGLWSRKTMSTNGLAKRLDFGELFAGPPNTGCRRSSHASGRTSSLTVPTTAGSGPASTTTQTAMVN